jgi:hypothetical protein
MSPVGSDRQNEVPSTSVTASPTCTGCPENVHPPAINFPSSRISALLGIMAKENFY